MDVIIPKDVWNKIIKYAQPIHIYKNGDFIFTGKYSWKVNLFKGTYKISWNFQHLHADHLRLCTYSLKSDNRRYKFKSGMQIFVVDNNCENITVSCLGGYIKNLVMDIQEIACD